MKQIIGLAVVVLLAGCAGLQSKVGEQRVIEQSASKPQWLNTPFYEEGDNIFASGAVNGVFDYAIGVREAESEALATLVKAIQQKVRYDFGRATKGQNLEKNDLGKIIESAIAVTTENIKVSGVKPERVEHQRVEETVTSNTVRYLYNCYVLVKISKADYFSAREKALNGGLEQAKAAKNQEAEQLLNLVKEKLNAPDQEAVNKK